MRRLDRSARSALLRGRGERRSPVSAAIATAAVTAAVATSSVTAPAVAAAITASTIASAAIATTFATTLATTTAASATVSTAVSSPAIAATTIAATITTAATPSHTIPGELDAHVYSARVDVHAGVWRLWQLRHFDGWVLEERYLAGSVWPMPAVRCAPVHAY